MHDPATDSYLSLYDEADLGHIAPSGDLTGEICPLYHSLASISGRYGEEKAIGMGGMKEVLRVYDAATERHVALARPKPDLPTEQYDAFLREAHITARLEHPNIIKLFDMGVDSQGRPFFTMEFKRGLSLRTIIGDLRKGRSLSGFPYEKRLSILLRILEAVSYAHSRRVLHLDLKPENIQIGDFGEVQVCDWGMGEIERGDTGEQLSSALLDPDLYGDQLNFGIRGTPGYMAPEQLLPGTTKTQRTDVFALGCLIYELCALRPPDDRHLHPPESLAISAIVSKACAERPELRYQDAESLRLDLYRHLRGFSTVVENAGFLRETKLFFRRNRTPCVITLVAALALFATAFAFTLQLRASYSRTAAALADSKVALENTEIARERADALKLTAEEALARYKEENAFSGALLDARTGSTLEASYLLSHTLIINESITFAAIDNLLRELDKAIARKDPDSEKLITLKGHVLFLTQHFAEAGTCFAIRVGDDADLQSFIPEFSKLAEPGKLLPVGDFNRLMRHLAESKKSRHPLIEKMLLYDTLKRGNPTETALALKNILQIANPDWKNPTFGYDPATRSLRIAGSGITSLYRKGARREETVVPVRSLLRVLPIDTLDLRGSGISDLWHLEGTSLTQLDIRNTPAKDLSPIVPMDSLRELIISPGQFSEQQLSVLPRNVKVREIAES